MCHHWEYGIVHEALSEEETTEGEASTDEGADDAEERPAPLAGD